LAVADKGVEAFKRLMFSNKDAAHSDTVIESEGSVAKSLAPPYREEDNTSLVSHRTDPSTGMTFVYTSDEEDMVSSAKHSPETRQRESPQILPDDKKSLPPLTIPQLSSNKPAPPPSRKRGASGSAQNAFVNSEKHEEKTTTPKKNISPAPPVPRRTLSSASTSTHRRPDHLSFVRSTPQAASETGSIKPPPPVPRRKLSDTSVNSFDIASGTTATRASAEIDRIISQSTTNASSSKRFSGQAPPPPPPPRGRKVAAESATPIGRSTDMASSDLTIDRPESPRRLSGSGLETSEMPIQDSDLSLELGRLQREVDELVYGLTKKRGGVVPRE